MVGYKVVSASLESLWCNQPAFVQPRRDGDPPRPLSFRTGETVEDDDVGVFCYDSPGHPMLTNGAWRTKYHDARVVEAMLKGAPAAGFFAAGEIGPVGGESFLHGFTATLAVFAS